MSPTRAPAKTLTVATDGSCLKNPGGATGWAWVAEDGRWAAGCQPVGTNQIAEVWGVVSVLRDFPVGGLVIQIDSAYAMNAATTWSKAWAKNGWKNVSGNPVSNLALMQTLHRLITNRRDTVQFVKVPGHDSRNRWPLNTAVDMKAGEAARYAQSERREHQFAGQMDPFLGPLVPPVGDAARGRKASRSSTRVELKPRYCTGCDGLIDPNGYCPRCS